MDTIKQVQMKELLQKEYIRRTRKLLETKLSSRNIIKGKIPGLYHTLDIWELFLKWIQEELKQIEQSTRKLMIMHN